MGNNVDVRNAILKSEFLDIIFAHLVIEKK
jgi:hypothetical protein